MLNSKRKLHFIKYGDLSLNLFLWHRTYQKEIYTVLGILIAVVISFIMKWNYFQLPEPKKQPIKILYYKPYVTFSGVQFDYIDLPVFQKLADTKVPETLRTNFYKYYPSVLRLSRVHGVDPFWILAVMWTESHFHYDALSPVGARGLMQIMPKTGIALRDMYRDKFYGPFAPQEYFDYTEPLVNIEFAMLYLKRLEKRFDDPELATIAYNVGPTKLKRLTRSSAAEKRIKKRNQYLYKVRKRYYFLLNAYQGLKSGNEQPKTNIIRIAKGSA